MDGFSPASVTSQATSISHRVISSIHEIRELVQTRGLQPAHLQRLAALTSALQQLSDQTSLLQSSLQDSAVFSDRLQALLGKYLPSIDGHVASMDKQLMRIQPDNLHAVDWSLLAAFGDSLANYTKLFSLFVRVLERTQQADQDNALDTDDARANIEHVDLSIHSLSSTSNDLLRQDGNNNPGSSSKADAAHARQRQDFDDPDEEVPPYEATPSASASGAGGAGSNFSKGLSSLTSSFKALMSGMRPKPEPFVSALCQAAVRNDVQQMVGFVKQGVNLDGRNEEGRTALQCAIMEDHQEAARFLLASGASWMDQKYSRLPPLYFAASLGSVGVAQLLLEKGAQVDDKNESGQKYFYDVVSKGSVPGAQLLLEHGADPNVQNISWQPAIIKAVKAENEPMIDLLLRHGANVNAADNSGNSVLYIAVRSKKTGLVKLVLERGASPDSKTVTGTTALVESIVSRQVEIAKEILSYGGDGSAKDVSGQPILMSVIRSRSMDPKDKAELARLLLEHGATPDITDISGLSTAIQIAVESSNDQVTDLLLQYGADVDSKTRQGEPLLTYAVSSGRYDLVDVLVKHGADLNAKDKQNRTPLMIAVGKQDMGLARRVRGQGVAIDEGTVVTIRDLATTMNRPDLLDFLGEAGVAGSSQTGPSGAERRSQGRRKSDEAHQDAVRPETPPPSYE